MQKTRIYEYYAFGYDHRSLVDKNDDLSNEQLHKRYRLYLEFLDQLNLIVTRQAAEMKGLIDEISTLGDLAEAAATSGTTVDKALHDSLREKLIPIDTVLDAELATKMGYILEPKRYSLDILTDDISKLFNKGYFQQMPIVAQHDFKESGLCLAFDRFTACAYHALRAIEDILKWYYSTVLGVVPTNQDTWGTYETAIKTAVNNATLAPPPSEQLMTNIESIRKHYRNKTQHPQLIYTDDESQDLLSLCVKTANDLISDMANRGKLAIP